MRGLPLPPTSRGVVLTKKTFDHIQSNYAIPPSYKYIQILRWKTLYYYLWTVDIEEYNICFGFWFLVSKKGSKHWFPPPPSIFLKVSNHISRIEHLIV